MPMIDRRNQTFINKLSSSDRISTQVFQFHFHFYIKVDNIINGNPFGQMNFENLCKQKCIEVEDGPDKNRF